MGTYLGGLGYLLTVLVLYETAPTFGEGWVMTTEDLASQTYPPDTRSGRAPRTPNIP